MRSGYFARRKGYKSRIIIYSNGSYCELSECFVGRPSINNAGISRRFGELDNNIDAQLTVVVHPHSNYTGSVMTFRKQGLR